MDFGLCFGPLPPLGIGLISVALREGVGVILWIKDERLRDEETKTERLRD